MGRDPQKKETQLRHAKAILLASQFDLILLEIVIQNQYIKGKKQFFYWVRLDL